MGHQEDPKLKRDPETGSKAKKRLVSQLCDIPASLRKIGSSSMLSCAGAKEVKHKRGDLGWQLPQKSGCDVQASAATKYFRGVKGSAA